LKELRQNTARYAALVSKGQSFIVVKKTKPLFKLVPCDQDEQWETIVDFTKLRRGGIRAEELLKYLK